jgi:hypothetical protein
VRAFCSIAGGDQFFRNSDEYANFVDLSPAYRLSWTPDKANNAIRMMIQVRPAPVDHATIALCRAPTQRNHN